MSFFKEPPYRRHYGNNDLEAGGRESDQEEESFSSSERLRERQAALALNASHQIRFTWGVERKEEEEQLLRRRRGRVLARIFAEVLKVFRKEPTNVSGTLKTSPSPPPSGDFAIEQDQLAVLSRDHNVVALQECGGSKDYQIR